MNRIWAFIRRDARHAYANAISIVVMVGIITVPSFYAWFNIAGSWDPYGETSNLKVAVANDDAGFEGELVPVKLNLGDRVVSELTESTSIGYTPTTHDEAIEGVRSGAYYAAVIIPEDFSTCLLSGLSSDPRQAEVPFYQNQKANAIAQIVTNKASAAVQQDIDSGFAEAVTDVGAGALEELSGLLDDDQLAGAAANLEGALGGASQTLRETAGIARSFSSLAGSSQALLDTSVVTLDAASAPNRELEDALVESADGLRGLDAAIDDAVGAVDGALAGSTSGLDDVGAAIDAAFDTASGQANELSGALGEIDGSVRARIDALRKLSDSLNGQDTLVKRYEDRFQVGSVEFSRVHEIRVTIEGINERVQQAIAELEELSSGLQQTSQDIERSLTDAGTARGELAQLVDDGAGLADARTALDTAAGELEDRASALDQLSGRIGDALASSDMDSLRSILLTSPAELGSFVASPVTVERHAVYPVENNGSAMAPFYTTLSIWIGGVVLAALVKATPSEAALRETGCTLTQSYLGRFALFAGTGIAQALLICGGDLCYLGVQCAHPVLFLLAGCVASLVFVNIIFALTTSFGDVGKAIAVVLMVLQVAGAGGTFPPQMLPAAFQAIFPWLPFVHAEGAMRAAMFGMYGADFWIELGLLALYLAPALLLGLVARRPVIRVNEKLEHALESTRIM
ncbi:YhgE/Pip domain-containing protein [Collinsella ihumii]|uniref:YhgE/Pip domain-containing protein n=1 Tax=Collinsella ihumii TaxID=1720204 RepID=UPI000836D6D0|nr:YhgE/Pip domain-containing protein [Collinsella ihumii]